MTLWRLFPLLLALVFLVVTCQNDDDDNGTPSGGALTVTAPNGGESWAAGSTHAITWTSNSSVSNVTISLSTDGGNQWQEIIANLANTGSYGWTVPGNLSAACRIRVADAANPNVADQSNGNFAIVQTSGGDNASAPVTSDSGAVIGTPQGTQLVVPEGAVPRFPNGDPATVVFSIEQTADVPALPAGQSTATPVYRFGPDGFVFARPVEIAIPVGDLQPGQVLGIYRINPTTEELEYFGGRYDSTTRTVRAQTIQLSPWFGFWSEPDPTAWGCFHVMNNQTGYWVGICRDSVSLRYPERDADYLTRPGVAFWSPPGHIGWASESDFFMPQGFHRICVQYHSDLNPEQFTHGYLEFTVDAPSYSGFTPVCPPWTISVDDSLDGRCPCTPTPTPPVGTGAIQVTLTWFNDQALDLDLWVTDPDSVRCWYANPITPSGGELDRDNYCGNYINGQPENIFWQSNPPAGEYIVEIDWYSDCGNGLASEEYNLRTVVQGVTRTYTGTIQAGETIEAIRFNVSGAAVSYQPQREVIRHVTGKPAK